jgi:Ser/Thr protein kinase RdoA (MazF antagonist)
MDFSREVIEEFLHQYDLGKLQTYTPLESGFESDNAKIITDTGIYVIRVLYHKPDRVDDTMKIYDVLSLNGIKTAKPIKTKKKSYYIEIDAERSIVVQEFIEGKPYYRENLGKNENLFNDLLQVYGKELGKVHAVSSDVFKNVKFKEIDPNGSIVKDILNLNPKFLHLPSDPSIEHQYNNWKIEANKILFDNLSFGICHDDIKPGDFFLIDDKLSGILDFNNARFGYLLADLAAMIMYCGMYKKNKQNRFLSFIFNYIEFSCVKIEELKLLQFFFKTRAMLQILYFSYRIQTQTIQGVGSQDDNFIGLNDGIQFVKFANELPKSYFYDLVKNRSEGLES